MADHFAKLLSFVKMNAVSQDKNGEWTIINSSTNKKRMNGDPSGRWWGSNGKSKLWIPKRVIVTPQELAEVWMKQGEKCYWFKIPLDFRLLYSNHSEYYPKHPLAPSVDRKDDNLDYTKDNVVICCRLANLGRNIYPFEGFHDIISTVKGETKRETLRDLIRG